MGARSVRHLIAASLIIAAAAAPRVARAQGTSCIPGFQFGITSKACPLDFGGNSQIDSWDSSTGAYPGSGAGTNGNIGAMGTGTDCPKIHGSSTTIDNVYTTGTEVTNGGPTINGSINSLSTAISLPSVTLPSGYTAGGAISTGVAVPNTHYTTVSGSVTFPTGSYLVDTLTTNVTVAVGTGPVTIYIATSFAPASIANNTNVPSNLLFMVGPSGTVSAVDGYYAVYAPDAVCSIHGGGGMNIYGGLVCNTVDISGHIAIHYDTKLSFMSGGGFSCTRGEASRASPIEATITNNSGTTLNAIAQGSFETTPLALNTISSTGTVASFTFPYIPGHMRARTGVATTSSFASTSNGEAIVFDVGNHCSVTTSTDCTTSSDCPSGEACVNGIPSVTNGGCGSFGTHGPTSVDGTCRNVWTNTTGGFLPAVKQLNDTNASTIGALIIPSSGAGSITGIGGLCGATSCWQQIVRKVLSGQSGGPMLGGVDRSTVAVIGASTFAGTARPTMAYFGATDGMLHAVCASNVGACAGKVGTELWAFMPRTQLPLVAINTTRIDGSPHVVDAFDDFYNSGTRSFKTILTFQTGSGCLSSVFTGPPANIPCSSTAVGFPGALNPAGYTGNQVPAVYALDITDPANPALLWEYSTPTSPGAIELGQGLTIGMGVVQVNGANTNVVFAETNNGGTGTSGVVVVAINAATGVPVSSFGTSGKFSYTYPTTTSSPAVRVATDDTIVFAGGKEQPPTGIPGGAAIVDQAGLGFVTDLVFADLYGDIWILNPATGVSRCGATTPLFSFTGASGDTPFGPAPTIYSNNNQQFAVIGSGGYADQSGAAPWGSGAAQLVGVSLNTGSGSSCGALGGGSSLSQSSPVDTTHLAFAPIALTGKDFSQAIVVGGQVYLTTDTANVNASGYTTGLTGAAFSVSIASPTLVAITGSNTGISGAGSLAFTTSSGTATLYSQQQKLGTTSVTGTGTNIDTMNVPRMVRKLWLRTQ